MALFIVFNCQINAQNPNNYCGVDQQDSIDNAATRFEATVFRVSENMAPVIDGIMEPIWFCSPTPDSMKREPGHDYDPNFETDIRFLYDSNWLYVAVNVLHDDNLYLDGFNASGVDRVELMFQNTWGGRKDGTYNHCNETNWWWYYWEQDGDRRWVMPSTKDFILTYDDQDINDACDIPHPANFQKEAPGWLTLGVLKQVLFEVDTAKLDDNTFRITYEMAFHLRDWLKYDDWGTGVTHPDEGHEFGLEVSIRDVDDDGMGGLINNGEYNMTDLADPADLAWCSPLAISMLTFGPQIENPGLCAYPDFCTIYPDMCQSTGYFLTVNVKNEHSNSNLSNATVNITGQGSIQTNGAGNAVFSGLEEGTYAYTISKEGYKTDTGSVAISGHHLVNETLKKIFPVTFNVMDQDLSSITGAVVSLTGYGTDTTDALGQAVFSEVEIAQDIDFSVNADGYNVALGTVDVSDVEVLKNIILSTGTDPIVVVSKTEISNFLTGMNSPSTYQTYDISANNLSQDILVSAPSGYEISLDNSSYSSSISVSNTGGTVPVQSVYVRLASSLTAGTISGNISHSSAGANDVLIAVSGEVIDLPDPEITATASFNHFYANTGMPSISQSYSIEAVGLINPLVIKAPDGFEISENVYDFDSIIILTPVVGTISSTSIYVRISEANNVGDISGNIFHESIDGTTLSLPVSGTVYLGNVPIILLDGTISKFSSIGGTPSNIQTYSLSAMNLNSDVSISCPSGFEISKDSLNFYSYLTINKNTGTVLNKKLYLRISNTAPIGELSGSILHAASGATDVNLAVSGTVNKNINIPGYREEKISIYPNPAESHIVIKSPGIDKYTINIIQLDGKVVLTEDCWNETNIVDLTSVQKGIYFIRISNQDINAVRRLIIQ